MENTVKILVITCFILIACIGVTMGFILQGNLLQSNEPVVVMMNGSK